MMMILSDKKPYFFADTSIHVNPTPEEMANIAKMAEYAIKSFAIQPKLPCFLTKISQPILRRLKK